MNATHEYTRNAVMTASRAKLVVMMYDGALRYSDQARYHLERGDTGRCGHAISSAYNVVSELKVALDYESGGEAGRKIAVDLAELYTFVMDRLVAANVEREAAPLSEATEILSTLREGWEGAAQQA